MKGGNLNLMKLQKKGLTLGEMYPAVLTIVLIGVVLIGLVRLFKVNS